MQVQVPGAVSKTMREVRRRSHRGLPTATILSATLIFAFVSDVCWSRSLQPRNAPPPDLLMSLNNTDQLFVGSIEKVEQIEYAPSGPCSDGVSPGRVTEVRVRTEEILHGAGIRRVEHIRWNPKTEDVGLEVGTRVLIYGQRTCADAWRIWGGVVSLGEGDRITDARGLGVAIRGWKSKHGRSPTLRDLRDHAKQSDARGPAGEFERFVALHLVRVSRVSALSPGVFVFNLEEISSIAGAKSSVPERIRVAFPWSGTTPISPGDSLVVPVRTTKDGAEKFVQSTLEYFRVDHGFLPGLGVTLQGVMRSFDRDRDEFVLSNVPKEAER